MCTKNQNEFKWHQKISYIKITLRKQPTLVRHYNLSLQHKTIWLTLQYFVLNRFSYMALEDPFGIKTHLKSRHYNTFTLKHTCWNCYTSRL